MSSRRRARRPMSDRVFRCLDCGRDQWGAQWLSTCRLCGGIVGELEPPALELEVRTVRVHYFCRGCLARTVGADGRLFCGDCGGLLVQAGRVESGPRTAEQVPRARGRARRRPTVDSMLRRGLG